MSVVRPQELCGGQQFAEVCLVSIEVQHDHEQTRDGVQGVLEIGPSVFRISSVLDLVVCRPLEGHAPRLSPFVPGFQRHAEAGHQHLEILDAWHQ